MPSSVVASMKYNPKAAVLRIKYVSGKVYDYINVPEDVFEEMKSSGSKGIFLNTRIKGKYCFRKVR